MKREGAKKVDIVTAEELADLKVNALEGRAEDFGGAEVLPSRWVGPHVERRLVEAFETLLICEQIDNGPAEYGTAWPDYADDWAQHVASARAFAEGIAGATEAERAIKAGWDEVARLVRYDKEEEFDRRKRPSAEQLTRMERAIAWPARYLGHGHKRMYQLLVAVQRVTQAKALGLNADWVARKLGGVSGDVWQGRCWAGCERIGWGLDRDRVVVF